MRTGINGQSHDPAVFPLGKGLLLPIGREAGWAPEPVWIRWRGENPWPFRESNPGLSSRNQPESSPVIPHTSVQFGYLNSYRMRTEF
jgi:hypothetical protein